MRLTRKQRSMFSYHLQAWHAHRLGQVELRRRDCGPPAPLHPIRKYKGGPFATQRIQMAGNNRDLDRGFYKVWYFGEERIVVDRAMTLKRARQLIAKRLTQADHTTQ